MASQAFKASGIVDGHVPGIEADEGLVTDEAAVRMRTGAERRGFASNRRLD